MAWDSFRRLLLTAIQTFIYSEIFAIAETNSACNEWDLFEGGSSYVYY